MFCLLFCMFLCVCVHEYPDVYTDYTRTHVNGSYHSMVSDPDVPGADQVDAQSRGNDGAAAAMGLFDRACAHRRHRPTWGRVVDRLP